MMSTQPTQPEALRLADELERDKWHVPAVVMQAAADELRRLYAENAQLREQNTALDAACAKLEAVRGTPATGGEPVAWRYQDARGNYRYRGYVPRFDKDYALLKPIPLYTSPQPVREPLTCEWSHNDDDGFWETSCGEAWRFDDGGPKENSMNFCHGCGKTLRITGGQHGTER